MLTGGGTCYNLRAIFGNRIFAKFIYPEKARESRRMLIQSKLIKDPD
jgi:hypothetical protein